MNSILINEVPKFLGPIPSETLHAIQIENPCDATHPVIIPMKSNRVTSYFKVRSPTQEEYADQNILKIELIMKAPQWDPFSPKFGRQEQTCLITGDSLSALTLQQEDNYLSTLSYGFLTMLQMLWMMTYMSLCWKVCECIIIVSSTS